MCEGAMNGDKGQRADQESVALGVKAPAWSFQRKWWMDLLRVVVAFILVTILGALVLERRERTMWERQVEWGSLYQLRHQNLQEFFGASGKYGSVLYDEMKYGFREKHGESLTEEIQGIRADNSLLLEGAVYDAFKLACVRIVLSFEGSPLAKQVEEDVADLFRITDELRELQRGPGSQAGSQAEEKTISDKWKLFSSDGLDDLDRVESKKAVDGPGRARKSYGDLRREFKLKRATIYRLGMQANNE